MMHAMLAALGLIPDITPELGRRSKKLKTAPAQFAKRVARRRARNRVARSERQRQRRTAR